MKKMSDRQKQVFIDAYLERKQLQDLMLKHGISHDAAGRLWGMKSSKVRHMLRGHTELTGVVRAWMKRRETIDHYVGVDAKDCQFVDGRED
jgi:hypothetical protein